MHAGRHTFEFDLLFLAGWLASTAVHEIGHAVTIASRGWRLISIVVGPFYITRSAATGLRLRMRRQLLGGMVVASPRFWNGDERFRQDFTWFVAAGPATSLVAGVVGLFLTHKWDMLWVWSIISIVIGVANLIPARYPTGVTSDGEKLRHIRHADAAGVALMALRFMLLSIRPREWDAALVAEVRAESETQGSDAIDATTLLYHYAIDSGDIVGAGAILQRLIDYTCGTARWPRTTISREAGLEACLFEAAWRSDLVRAQEWLARTPIGKRKPVTLEKLIANVQRGNMPVYRATIERIGQAPQ